MGEAPTEAKLHELSSALEKSQGGTITFEELVSAVKQTRAECPRPSKTDLEIAFRTIDKSKTGIIAISDLKEALTTLGEPLDAAELDRVLAEIDIHDGKVDCEKLAKLLSS